MKTIYKSILLTIFITCSYPAISQSLDNINQTKFNQACLFYQDGKYQDAFNLFLQITNSTAHAKSYKYLADICKDYFKNYNDAVKYYKKAIGQFEIQLKLVDKVTQNEEYSRITESIQICNLNLQSAVNNGGVENSGNNGNNDSISGDNNNNNLDDAWGGSNNNNTSNNNNSNKNNINNSQVNNNDDSDLNKNKSNNSQNTTNIDTEKNPWGVTTDSSSNIVDNNSNRNNYQNNSSLVSVNQDEITLTTEKITFKFYDGGRETTYLTYIALKDKNFGWHIPSPKELKTILLSTPKLKDQYDIFQKFNWDKRDFVNFLTNERHAGDELEPQYRCFYYRKIDSFIDEKYIEFGGLVSIILVKNY